MGSRFGDFFAKRRARQGISRITKLQLQQVLTCYSYDELEMKKLQLSRKKESRNIEIKYGGVKYPCRQCKKQFTEKRSDQIALRTMWQRIYQSGYSCKTQKSSSRRSQISLRTMWQSVYLNGISC